MTGCKLASTTEKDYQVKLLEESQAVFGCNCKDYEKAVKVLEFYTDKVYTAKKVHKCDLCNQEIIIGEKYHRQSGKYEGDPLTGAYTFIVIT